MNVMQWALLIGCGVILAEGTSAAAVTTPGPVADASSSAFGHAHESLATRQVVEWVVAAGDNQGLNFIIVDKVDAQLYLFGADGTLRATTPVLLGLAYGDDTPRGVGTKKLEAITPGERITPAGRFVTSPGEDLDGKALVWIDYAAAIALHRASDHKPGMTRRSRVERLASAVVRDRRVSFGCINVSSTFFDNFIAPTLGVVAGIVYILPESRSARVEFNIPFVTPLARLAATAQ